MTTILNILETKKLHTGLIAICEGGGMANACIIEIIYEVYAHGFFDQMRKASLTEIAKNLGISTATQLVRQDQD